MMLSDLYKQIEPHFTPSLQKDLKTAVKTLATVLKYSDPAQCPVDQLNRPLPELYGLLESHLRAKGRSPNTVRNVKNNVSRLLRYAEEHDLLTIKPPIPVRKFTYKEAQKNMRRPDSYWDRIKPDGSYLRMRNWPKNLIKDWQTYYAWATDPVVEGRDARLRKRDITLLAYQRAFESFFGYLAHVRQLEDLSFDQIFNFDLIRGYVHWHINEKHKRVTAGICQFLKTCIALANQYRPMPEFKEQLKELRRTLPTPTPLYDKKDVWISLADFRCVGHGLWPTKRPEDICAPPNEVAGANTAYQAGFSIIFRLWTYIPYRQRNIREMQLGENLYKDSNGNWRIRFVGEQLKIATKKGKTNVFDLPFPTDLVPDLETYLSVWRPILAGRTNNQHPHVFLKKNGKTWASKFGDIAEFGRVVKSTTHVFLGKYTTPHMIRTIWATEWIKNTHGDFYTAAVMLNDKLETVIKNYSELLEEDVAEKAYRLVNERMNKSGKIEQGGV